MQRLDEKKRQAILEIATRLFADRPFHEVRLDDVAAEAHLGKGTLYLYFPSKQELYRQVILDGFDGLLCRLQAQLCEDKPAWDVLSDLVGELVRWGKAYPHAFSLMRPEGGAGHVPDLVQRRKDLAKLIETAIRRGVERGELDDPRPDLTANFLPACVRATLRFGPSRISADALTQHILRILGHGIRTEAVSSERA